MCRSCLAAASASGAARARDWGRLVWPLLALAGWLFVWMLAYYAGDLLTRLPSAWHGVEES